MTKRINDDEDIVSEIGPNVFPDLFKGERFIPCLIEAIKNSRDYGANSIRISSPDLDTFVILDNGKGMGRKNRSSFMSVGMSTQQGSAQFGTGAKKLIFSHALSFSVRTVTQEDPNRVCQFACTVDKLNKMIRNTGRTKPKFLPKNQTNWPHPFNTGTEITFTLREPKRKAILRGQELADELAAFLPMKFRGIITIDGKELPDKRIIGSIFVKTIPHSQLGEVAFEIYRPEEVKKSAGRDRLFLGSGEVGEIPIHDFYLTIGSALSARFPMLFLLKEICGFISVPYLRKHAKEDRKSVNTSVADDPLTVFLVDVFRSLESEVKRTLQIESKKEDDSQGKVVSEITQLLETVYGQNLPSEAQQLSIEDGGTDEDARDDDTERQKRPLYLHVPRHEYGVNELIEVTLGCNQEIAKRYNLDFLEWSATDGIVSKPVKTGRGIELRALKVGHAKILVDLPGTPHSASVNIAVVKRRRLGFSRHRVEVTQGASVLLYLRNADTLKGNEMYLTTTGRNKPVRQDTRCITYKADMVETATVTVTDAQDARNTASCEVTVLPPETKLLVIRGIKFRVKDSPAVKIGRESAVTIVRTDAVHELLLNPENQYVATVRKHGDMQTFFVLAIGLEVARFKLVDIDQNGSEYGSVELHQLINELGLDIMNEILNGKPVASKT
ncbi:MAG: ATP-binding protein [Patescibacteria group bacterium]